MPLMETQPLPLPFPEPGAGPHHLDSLAAEIHRTYFYNVPPLPVFWGPQIRRKTRRSIRVGSSNPVMCEIRIHPHLNPRAGPSLFTQSLTHDRAAATCTGTQTNPHVPLR